MKLNDLEVTQSQKNNKAKRFLESHHRVKVDNIDVGQANTLLSKVHKLKEERFYSSPNFHNDPNYTKLAMLEQLLKEAADGVLDDIGSEVDTSGDTLEQAELVLAVQDIIDDIMGMAEDLAAMQVQKLMPIVAKMKTASSMEQAQSFENSANEALTSALSTIKATNDSMTNAVAVLQGKAAPTSMSTDLATTDDTGAGDLDGNAGHDAASGPEDEPLGRGLKDETI